MIADPAPVAVQVLAEGLRFPEGPAFDSRGRLWLVELKGAGLAWWQDGRLTRVPVGGAPNGIAIDARGDAYVAAHRKGRFAQLRPEWEKRGLRGDRQLRVLRCWGRRRILAL